MRVARIIATLATAFAMALALLVQAIPAAGAVAGYDSRYFGESAFVTLAPGEENQFAVGFTNTGSTGWQRGTASQVNLVQCCPYNTASPNSSWAVGWLSSTAYATTTTDFVGPGQIGWFVYTVKAPTGAAPGSYRFDGDTAVASLATPGTNNGMIQPEGYHQIATIPVGPQAATLEITPSFQFRQVGTSAQFQATVTTATDGAVPNTNVTCFIDADEAGEDLGNKDISLSGNTDSNGVATFNYTRNFGGQDLITCYVTNLPIVRDTGNVQWGGASAAITVTPTTNASNPTGDARTYTITVFDIDTGDPRSGVQVDITFAELLDDDDDNDPDTTALTFTNCTLQLTSQDAICETGASDADGEITITIDSSADNTVTPVAWRDNAEVDTQGGDADDVLDDNEFRGQGGTKSWEEPRPIITVTPDGAVTLSTNGQRVYTISAVDQFGNDFTGTVDIGFTQTTDLSTATATDAVIAWQDGTSTPATDPENGCGVPTGATGVNAQHSEVNLNGDGDATFAICSANDTTATPVVWWDDPDGANDVRENEDPQDTGGTITFEDPVASAAAVSPASATNPASPDATSGAFLDLSLGEETFTVTLVDQSAFDMVPENAEDVDITVTNTGDESLWIVDCNGTPTSVEVSAGEADSTTCDNLSLTTDTGVTVTIDAADATTASVSATITTDDSAFSDTGTKTWIDAIAEPACGPGAVVTGDVVFVDAGADETDGGMYIVSTTVGNFLITYGAVDTTPAAGGDVFMIETTQIPAADEEADWEAALDVGDELQWSCDTTPATEIHHITTDN